MSTEATPPFRHILYQCDAGVARITLNQPERRNPLSAAPDGNRSEMITALRQAGEDNAIGCILIDAAGPTFSAGGDLQGNPRRDTVLDDYLFMQQAEAFHASLRDAAKPVIASVHGFCLGAAMDMIAQCDITIAAAGARFGLVEGRMGLAGAAALIGRIDPHWAKYLIFTGEMISARRARRIGLVLEVVPDDALAARSTDLAQRIARMPREALLLNKATINRVQDAAGAASGRLVGLATEAITTRMAASARAPDGRMFRDIIRADGMRGVRQAQEQQYSLPWLDD